MSLLSDEKIYEKTYDDGSVKIEIALDKQFRSLTRFYGKGTMGGARAFVAMLDEMVAVAGRENKTQAMSDLSQLHGSPVRAQFVIGKWLFKNKDLVDAVAVFGGRPWEMKLAKAVMKIARLDGVGFFQNQADAERFLGWGD